MCGICGFCDFTRDNAGPVWREAGERMGETLAHRGPDGKGLWQGADCVLVHRRLAVIDPERGQQPMARVRDGVEYVLIYNGELYNTDELRRELRKRGISHLKVVYSKEPPIRPLEDMSISCRSHCICPPGTKHKCTDRRDIPGSNLCALRGRSDSRRRGHSGSHRRDFRVRRDAGFPGSVAGIGNKVFPNFLAVSAKVFILPHFSVDGTFSPVLP